MEMHLNTLTGDTDMTSAAASDSTEEHPFSVDDFTASLLAGIADKGKSRLPIGDPRVEAGFREIVDLLRHSAVTASKQGSSEIAFQILGVLEELRPDPNSGLLDGFWASLRRQQPGRASVPNPSYNYLQVRMSSHDAKAQLHSLPKQWRSVVTQSVDLLMKQL
jgi:hypothetical protein